MPSQRIISQLLKKSFDIVNEASNGSTRNTYNELQELRDLLKGQKRDINKQRDKAKAMFGASKKKAGYKSLSSYEDPFAFTSTTISQTESKPKKTPKPGNMSVRQAVRMRKKIEQDIEDQDYDYGEQQKQIQKKRNANMFMGMLGLGAILVVFAAIGMN